MRSVEVERPNMTRVIRPVSYNDHPVRPDSGINASMMTTTYIRTAAIKHRLKCPVGAEYLDAAITLHHHNPSIGGNSNR